MEVIRNADSVFDRLLAFAGDGLLIDSPKLAAYAAFLAELDAGTDAVTAVATRFPQTRKIQYADIVSVSSNKLSELVYVKYRKDRKLRSQTISCQDVATTERVLDALHERLGFARTEQRFGPVRAALRPAAMITLAGLATVILSRLAVMFQTAGDYQISGSNRLVKRIFAGTLELLGPTGVILAGAMLMLVLAFWLVRRLKTPPIMVRLQPKR